MRAPHATYVTHLAIMVEGKGAYVSGGIAPWTAQPKPFNHHVVNVARAVTHVGITRNVSFSHVLQGGSALYGAPKKQTWGSSAWCFAASKGFAKHWELLRCSRTGPRETAGHLHSLLPIEREV